MSNRSSHLAHRFQTLPSALAGVPGSRRLLALAAVLALLALTLLPTAAPAQTDTTPPALESATVEPAGTAITLVFNELITYAPFLNSFDPTAHFSVTADGNTITVKEYAVHFDPSGLLVADIELNRLSPGITRGQLVTVSYTPTTVDDPAPLLQDAASNAVAAFTTGSGGVPAVVNNVRPDLTPPALESATVLPDGTTIELVFDEVIDDNISTVSSSLVSVTAAGSPITVGVVAVGLDASSTRRLVQFQSLSPAITYGQVVTVSYTDPDHDNTSVLQDPAGNDVASFTTGSGGVPAVVNNVPLVQTVEPTELWSATMTVGSFPGTVFLGWNDTNGYAGSSLSDQDFDYGEHTYDLQTIAMAAGGANLTFRFNETGAGDIANAVTRNKLTLHVGSTSFKLTDGSLHQNNRAVVWANSGLIWAAADMVALKLTTTDPGAPGLTATPGPAKVTLSWTLPTTSGGSAITGYEYRQRTGNDYAADAWTEIPNSASLTSYNVTGLTPGTAYTFQLRARNSSGAGLYSQEVTATPELVDKSLPSTPTGLRWKRAGDEGGRATLTWGPPADDGNRPILRYEIQTDAGEWETVPGGGAAREITFTNLNYNQRYIYNLRAVNEVGPSAETWTENVLLRPGAPGAPGNLTAEAVSPSEIRLSWQRPSHGPDIQIVGYYFEVSLDGRDWSYSNFLLDQEYEDTFGEEGSGDDEFDLDDDTPSTRDSIGRDAARHYRVSALSVYTPALDDDDPYEDGLTRGPASEPVRATTTETPTSEPASGSPLTGFELVDATAHLDAGAVEDGATLTGIDPAKVYGFRANVASGAELKSVKLELSGPGPDDRVARTENYKPYSLRGDSDGHEHGAALPTGSYTLTATAYSEKDGGGSQLGTLSIEFTVTGGPLTARILYEEPQGYHSGSGTTLTVRLSFSEAVSTTPEALRDHALEVTNATVEAVSRVDERSDLWEVRLTPESDATVTVAVSPAADCDAAGAVCTEDGRTLASGAGTAIPGPPPNSPATGVPTISGTEQVGETLTADVTAIADDDKLTNAVFAYQWLRGDTDIAGANGSSYTLVSEDEGRTIKVRVSITDNAGHAETRTSDPTGAVAAKPNTKATGAPTIGGIARVGETLTADPRASTTRTS